MPDNWKADLARSDGYYSLRSEATRGVEVRLFLTAALLADLEDKVYDQILNATRFPGRNLSSSRPTCITATACRSGACCSRKRAAAR
ncbi:MAG TPA: hypothetical protein VN934_01870 [Candidatus Tumulicola sp.]|nr:hypothetical protein [Candidatus Tumulicola sp.]